MARYNAEIRHGSSSVPPARGFRDSARFQARRWVFGDIKQGYIRKLPPLSCETIW
ncbi:hypothetical protein Bca4012_094534 [Brassica carinata]